MNNQPNPHKSNQKHLQKIHFLLLDKSQTIHFPNWSCSKCQVEIQIQAPLSKFFFCKYPLFSSSWLHKILLIRNFTLEAAWRRRVFGRPLPSCLPAVQEGSAVDGGDQAGGAGGAGVTLTNWIVAVQSFSRVWLFVTPWTAARQASLSTVSWCLLKFMSIESTIHSTISFSVASFSSCCQSFSASATFPISWLFHQVAKVLELQLQHLSFQWIFRTDFP